MEENKEQQVQEQPAERDFEGEVKALYEARPEMKGQELPQEVVEACMEGKTVSEAYTDYARKKHQEARIQRQNEKNAAKAPVRGLSGGGATNVGAEDAFLRGFNTAW